MTERTNGQPDGHDRRTRRTDRQIGRTNGQGEDDERKSVADELNGLTDSQIETTV